MKCRRMAGKLAGLLLCILLIVVLFPPESAYAEDKEVRVGFFAFDGYHIQDEKGDMSGYGYEIVRYMEEYSALSFVFQGYEASWRQSQDMLENGEIDMLTSAQMTEDRLKRFSFSDRPIGTSSAILTVKAGNTTYLSGDYPHWNGMRVGLIEGSSRNADLAAFAVEQGFTYTGVIYKDVDAMLEALSSGEEIDAVLTSNLRRTENEWILAQFAPSPFYAMVRKGDSELLSEINKAIALMYTAMPNIDSLLMEKYYLADGGNVAFTAEELAVIAASARDPVTVGILAETPPLCYLDEATGEYIGISMELLQLVCENTELRMEFHPLDLSRNAPVGWLRAGETDLVAGILKVQTFINDTSLILSDSIVSDSVVMVGKKGNDFTKNPSEKTLALVLGFQIGNEYVATHFPEHNTVMYDSFADCMNAVAGGEADALIYLRTCASHFLSNPRYESLEIIPAYSMDVVTCAAGIAERDELLMSIIDKGLSMISDSEINAVIMEHTLSHPYQPSLSETLYQYRVALITVGMLLVFIIAAVILFFTLRRKTARKLMAAYENTKDALKLAETANASKSRFLSRMSHEMRTPLNAIIGYNTILGDVLEGTGSELEYKEAAGKALDCVEKSSIASKHLLMVINDVLDMSAIESGKFKIACEAFDFKETIFTLTTMFSSQAKEKGVDMAVIFKPSPEAWYMGDQMRLNQILTNLLSNAIKFTPAGKRISLQVSETPQSAETVLISFVVADEGIGMNREFLQNIWNPFEQADSSISRRFGGTGLGLTITKSLVDMMGGSISVESEPGAGSVFRVEIPLGRMEQPEKEILHDVPSAGGSKEQGSARDFGGTGEKRSARDFGGTGEKRSARDFGGTGERRSARDFGSTGERRSARDYAGAHILLAEDNKMNMEIAKAILSSWNLIVEEAWNGVEVVSKFSDSPENTYALIFMDVHMPEMDGYQATQTIRQLQRADAASVPILAMTADVFAEDVVEAMSAGMNAHIGKPIDIAVLGDMLDKYIRCRG